MYYRLKFLEYFFSFKIKNFALFPHSAGWAENGTIFTPYNFTKY